MRSETTMNPSGGVDYRHVMEGHPLDSVTVAHVVQKDNMQKAWKQVKANKGIPGVDNMTIEEFPEYAFRHWEEIKAALLEGTYQSSPVKRVEIPKDSSGTRPLLSKQYLEDQGLVSLRALWIGIHYPATAR